MFSSSSSSYNHSSSSSYSPQIYVYKILNQRKKIFYNNEIKKAYLVYFNLTNYVDR